MKRAHNARATDDEDAIVAPQKRKYFVMVAALSCRPLALSRRWGSMSPCTTSGGRRSCTQAFEIERSGLLQLPQGPRSESQGRGRAAGFRALRTGHLKNKRARHAHVHVGKHVMRARPHHKVG